MAYNLRRAERMAVSGAVGGSGDGTRAAPLRPPARMEPLRALGGATTGRTGENHGRMGAAPRCEDIMQRSPLRGDGLATSA